MDTENGNQSAELSLHETSTADGASNSSAELSRTFTIDDNDQDESKEGSALEIVAELITDEYAANSSVKATPASKPDQITCKQLELSHKEDQNNDNLNKPTEKEPLNRTFDANTSQEKTNLELSFAETSKKDTVEEPAVIDKNISVDGEKKILPEVKSLAELDKELPEKSTVDVIEDIICEELPTTATQSQHEGRSRSFVLFNIDCVHNKVFPT